MGTFAIRPDGFFLDDKPFQVISGTIHYFRVVPEYWEDRLLRLKAMGCNTVETYIAWNLHEPRKGEFCFTGMADVAAFVRLAQKIGLYVILRPSPYICAEWEFGGFPAWLLKEDAMRLRCSDPRFMRHVADYYRVLLPLLTPLQITRGGSVIMMQVENEYGSFGNDKAYLAALRDLMLNAGVDVPLVTSDGPEHDMLISGQVDGVFQMGNFGSGTRERFQVLADHGIAPQMCMEFWCGWFDYWGNGGHATSDAAASAADFADALALGHINLYMFHGGTSFGFMNGANYYDNLTPDTTSYDYDAPLTEDGRETEKYRLFKAAIEQHLGAPIPPVEIPPIPRKGYGEATLRASCPLLSLTEALPTHTSPFPMSMERLGQDYGYTLYHTVMGEEREIRQMRLIGANDRAHILLNGRTVATWFDHELEQSHTFDPALPVKPGDSLDILVENLGRVNYSWKLEYQRKGIDGGVMINGHLHYGWEMRCLDAFTLSGLLPEGKSAPADAPGVHELTFRVDQPADTFLDLSAWGKASVFLNGRALGRMWDVGPQSRLYIPAPLLHIGLNRLLIVETEGKSGAVLLVDEPALG